MYGALHLAVPQENLVSIERHSLFLCELLVSHLFCLYDGFAILAFITMLLVLDRCIRT